MNVALALEHRAQVEAFQRRHRVALLTLVFTDIVGSTHLKQALGDEAGALLLERHHALLRQILGRFPEGEEIERAGDSFFIVFARPSDAVKFALLLQSALRALSPESALPVLDRVGVHLGEVLVTEHPEAGGGKDLYGLQVDVCARVMSLAEGNQVLMTRAVFDSARQVLRGRDIPGVGALTWLNHGPYVLKGVDEPLEISEVGETGSAVLRPPADSEKVHRHLAPDSEPVLGWRPAIGQPVPGTQWVLERQLGEGGFGEVWLGRHEVLKEQRVFKFCFRADRVRSLKREVTIFRLLRERVGKHANIVAVQDVFLDQPPFYLVMDYGAGRDLKAWAEAQGGVRKVPLPTRLEAIAQTAEALQAAHQAGVLHRDVKPTNILVGTGEDGALRAQLTDFGIGQVVSTEALGQMTRLGFTQTMVGPGSSYQSGTQLYMAPELLAGQTASPQSDIYSLGVVLYQLLLGDWSRPVTTDWARDVSDPLLREDLERCFAGRPAERFRSAAELAENLRHLPQRQAAREARQAAQAGRERAAYQRGVLRAATVALVIIAVLSGLAFYAREQAAKARAAAERASDSELQALRQKELAQRLAQESSQRLVRQYLDKGNQALHAGDYLRSLVWFSEALRLDQGNPEREKVHRIRLAAILNRCPKLTRVIFPEGAVQQAEFSPDGALILGLTGRQLQAWDATTGHDRSSLLKHRDNAGTFGVTRNRLWVISEDELNSDSGRGWDVLSGEPLTPPLISDDLAGSVYGAPLTLAESAAGRWLVAAGFDDDTAEVWDVASGQAIAAPLVCGVPLAHVALAADGSCLAVAAADGSTRIWSLPSGPTAPASVTVGEVASATLRPDQTATETVYLPSETGRFPEPMATVSDEGQVDCLAVSPDGSRLITARADYTVHFWETKGGKPVGSPLQHTDRVNSAAFGPNGQLAVTASEDGTARVWDSSSGRSISPPLVHSGSVDHASFSRNGQRLVTSSGRVVRVFERQRAAALPIRLPGAGFVAHAAFSPDGRRVIAAGNDGSARIYDVPTGWLATPPLTHASAVRHVAYSADGRRVATASADRTARVWEAGTGQPLSPPLEHGGEVVLVAFNPAATRIVTASRRSSGTDAAVAEIRVWEAEQGRALSSTVLSGRFPAVVRFDAAGGRTLALQDDGGVQAWDAATGRATTPPVVPPEWFPAGESSPDHQSSAQVNGGVVRLCVAATGEPKTPPMEHRGEVDQVWFSPNSQFLATLSLASIVIIWDAATGYQVTPPLQHGDAVADARFSPDARVLLTTVRAGGAWLWRLEALPSSAEDVAALAQYLAGHRIDETGALIALDRSELKAAAGLVEKRIPTELASDGEELRIWHLDELAACEASRRWADALSQVAWLRLAEPTNWEHAARQAFAHANLGQWAGAIASFERSLQLGADPGRLLPFLADAQLAEGSTNGYRTTCARLLEAAARERSASLTNLAAWVCALAPNASEITRTALEWAQATMTDQPADVAALATLGALLYRVGRFGEARAVLEKAAPNQTASGNTCAALFLAMACLRTGESKVAESQLVEAQVEMARRRASAGDRALDRSAVSWEQAVEFELVAAEASRELGRAVKRVE